MHGRGRVTASPPYRELPFGARQPAAAVNITSEQSAQHPAVQAPPAAPVTGHSFEWPTLSAIRVVPQRILLCLLTGQGFYFFLSIGEEVLIAVDQIKYLRGWKMRKQLNLNKYYEGLELAVINDIFSRMLDLKLNIDGLDYVYNASEERFEQTDRWKEAKFIAEGGIRYQTRKIDGIMREHNKETVFGTTDEMSFGEEDYRAIIVRYRYLMSEPKTEE